MGWFSKSDEIKKLEKKLRTMRYRTADLEDANTAFRNQLATFQARNERQAEIIASFGDRACGVAEAPVSIFVAGDVSMPGEVQPVVGGGESPGGYSPEDDERVLRWGYL